MPDGQYPLGGDRGEGDDEDYEAHPSRNLGGAASWLAERALVLACAALLLRCWSPIGLSGFLSRATACLAGVLGALVLLMVALRGRRPRLPARLAMGLAGALVLWGCGGWLASAYADVPHLFAPPDEWMCAQSCFRDGLAPAAITFSDERSELLSMEVDAGTLAKAMRRGLPEVRRGDELASDGQPADHRRRNNLVVHVTWYPHTQVLRSVEFEDKT